MILFRNDSVFRRVLALLVVFLGVDLSQAKEPSVSSGLPEQLNDDNFQAWLAFVRPKESELQWRKIGWRTKLWPAVLEARKLSRPILLWTMNGHPLGCT